MQKNLSWLLSHLDSQNVKSINTNLTRVESADGATTLDGAQILMRDSTGRLRAALGKTESGNFVFEIYDKKGTAAIHLDAGGNAVFSGNIEGADISGVNIAGASITGADISGASITGVEIEGSNIRIAPNIFKDYIALENDGKEDTLSLYYGGTRIGGIRMLDAGGMEIFGKKFLSDLLQELLRLRPVPAVPLRQETKRLPWKRA